MIKILTLIEKLINNFFDEFFNHMPNTKKIIKIIFKLFKD